VVLDTRIAPREFLLAVETKALLDERVQKQILKLGVVGAVQLTL
jgi:hypothetical protein